MHGVEEVVDPRSSNRGGAPGWYVSSRSDNLPDDPVVLNAFIGIYLCRIESARRRGDSEFMNLGRRYVLFTRKKSVYADSAAITGKPGGSAVIQLIMPELGEYPAGPSPPGAGRKASGAEPRHRDQRPP